jgi:hypothetical protein
MVEFNAPITNFKTLWQFQIMKPALIFCLLLIALIACSKPISNSDKKSHDFAVVFATTLRDTLPASTYRDLNIQNVQGIKIADLNGHDVRYFRYNIDKLNLLNALSRSPFGRDATLADTVCRKIQSKDLSSFLNDELSYSTEFIDADKNGAEIFECIKPPLKHLLLFNRESKQVLHRIEILNI